MLCRYSMYSTVLSHIDTNIYHKNEECYLNVIQHVKAEYEMQLLKLITYVVDIILKILIIYNIEGRHVLPILIIVIFLRKEHPHPYKYLVHVL